VLLVLVAVIACEVPRATFDFTMESCIEGAMSMRFEITCSSCDVASIVGTSSNVIDATIESASPGQFTVVAHLNQLALHELVDFTFEAAPEALANTPQEAAISNVVFYPTQEPGEGEPCPPSGTPTVTVLSDIGCGAKIELSNTHNPAPVYVPVIEIATTPQPLAQADLRWGNATLEGLSWCRQLTNEFVLINPFDNTFSICLNEAGLPCGVGAISTQDDAATGAVLLRFESLYNGLHHRGIVQIELVDGKTLGVEETTWGRVKSLYRK
jgi:hypothetical protein